MTQRYKIIAQKEGIKIVHYELWFEEKFLWKNRWRAVQDYGFRHSFTKKFRSVTDIKEYIDSLNVTRTVIEEGTIE